MAIPIIDMLKMITVNHNQNSSFLILHLLQTALHLGTEGFEIHEARKVIDSRRLLRGVQSKLQAFLCLPQFNICALQFTVLHFPADPAEYINQQQLQQEKGNKPVSQRRRQHGQHRNQHQEMVIPAPAAVRNTCLR